VPFPLPLAEIAGWFGSVLPVPPMTRDQMLLLRSDNIASQGALTLADLGLAATPAEAVVPGYLSRYRVAGGLSRPHTSL
jgi:NADH dehydrogenase